MQIKELEGHVGLPLFDRTGKKAAGQGSFCPAVKTLSEKYL